jgi:hypothetical protein
MLAASSAASSATASVFFALYCILLSLIWLMVICLFLPAIAYRIILPPPASSPLCHAWLLSLQQVEFALCSASVQVFVEASGPAARGLPPRAHSPFGGRPRQRRRAPTCSSPRPRSRLPGSGPDCSARPQPLPRRRAYSRRDRECSLERSRGSSLLRPGCTRMLP